MRAARAEASAGTGRSAWSAPSALIRTIDRVDGTARNARTARAGDSRGWQAGRLRDARSTAH